MVKLFREREVVDCDGARIYEYDYDAEATRNATFAETVRRTLTGLALDDPRQYASLCEQSGLIQAAQLLRGMWEALQVARLAEQGEIAKPGELRGSGEETEQPQVCRPYILDPESIYYIRATALDGGSEQRSGETYDQWRRRVESCRRYVWRHMVELCDSHELLRKRVEELEHGTTAAVDD